MAEKPTFGRYAEIPYDKMTPEQQDAYRSLIETRGRLPGPNKIYVHNPKLAKVMGPLGAYFRTGYSLSEREREIAVCIINSHWRSAYPTSSHERSAPPAFASMRWHPAPCPAAASTPPSMTSAARSRSAARAQPRTWPARP